MRCSGCGHLPRPSDITLTLESPGTFRFLVARHTGCCRKFRGVR